MYVEKTNYKDQWDCLTLLDERITVVAKTEEEAKEKAQKFLNIVQGKGHLNKEIKR